MRTTNESKGGKDWPQMQFSLYSRERSIRQRERNIASSGSTTHSKCYIPVSPRPRNIRFISGGVYKHNSNKPITVKFRYCPKSETQH